MASAEKRTTYAFNHNDKWINGIRLKRWTPIKGPYKLKFNLKNLKSVTWIVEREEKDEKCVNERKKTNLIVNSWMILSLIQSLNKIDTGD